jgi:hypothetical protein
VLLLDALQMNLFIISWLLNVENNL